MSGICGIINIDGKPVNVKELKQMTELLDFRGPDGTNMWIDGSVGLGHTLFITTSQPENQPLTLDGQVYLTADARIDARDELIPQLQAMGSRVTDQATAAELILHAYQVWGEDFLFHLLGDFAFALWDKEKQKLLCGRDHFGLRVLYYAQIGQTFVFSNVIKCLQDYPGVRKKLNEITIGDFLLFGQDHYWLDKSITLWEDINKVPPAHFLSLDLSGNKLIKPYWHFPWDTPHLQYNDDEEVLSQFRYWLTMATRDRMRTDRIIIFMSGGMDSITIAALATEIVRQESPHITLTAITNVVDRVHPDSERYYASLVAEKLGLNHIINPCDDHQYIAGVPLSATDRSPLEPGSYGRVALTGCCADNLLKLPKLTTMVGILRQQGIKGIGELINLRYHYKLKLPLGSGLVALTKGTTYNQPAVPYPEWLNPDFEQRLGLKERYWEYYNWEPDPVHSRHPAAHKWMVFPDWTVKAEYNPNGKIARPERVDPYADLRFINFILSLPPLPWLYKKYIQRRALVGYLPTEVLQRKKTPLGLLQDSLLALPGVNWVDQWEPVPILNDYILRNKVPKLVGTDCPYKGLNLRPLALNNLLKESLGVGV